MRFIDRLADTVAHQLPFRIKKAYMRYVMRHHNRPEAAIRAYIRYMETDK